MKIKNLIFASTSSVYGDNKKFPLVENLKNLKPTSLYGSTKLFNEEMARIVSSQNRIKCIGVRFFTVYGPFGRPDMSLFMFTKNILNKKKIDVFNNGKHVRDFTYIDDVINALVIIFKNLKKEKDFNIYNIASGRPVKLMKFINEIQKNLNLKAIIKFKNLQRGDIVKTHANINKIKKLGYKSKTNYKSGVSKFVEWYKKNQK